MNFDHTAAIIFSKFALKGQAQGRARALERGRRANLCPELKATTNYVVKLMVRFMWGPSPEKAEPAQRTLTLEAAWSGHGPCGAVGPRSP